MKNAKYIIVVGFVIALILPHLGMFSDSNEDKKQSPDFTFKSLNEGSFQSFFQKVATYNLANKNLLEKIKNQTQ